jgi:hypothetical protein
MIDCKSCTNYKRCTVVHCFEYNQYKDKVDCVLSEQWGYNPDDIALKRMPLVEVKIKNCYAFSKSAI